MKIRFNGVMEKKTHGCPVCGGAKVDVRWSATKSYYLPSGKFKAFRAGQKSFRYR